ncbi:MAG: hypothetical protein HZB99_01350 [Candidatus Harrisonbacteria bacterium]|nr:hypothetical protein [Candidatus Harrisonbacteria bacterium]
MKKVWAGIAVLVIAFLVGMKLGAMAQYNFLSSRHFSSKVESNVVLYPLQSQESVGPFLYFEIKWPEEINKQAQKRGIRGDYLGKGIFLAFVRKKSLIFEDIGEPTIFIAGYGVKGALFFKVLCSYSDLEKLIHKKYPEGTTVVWPDVNKNIFDPLIEKSAREFIDEMEKFPRKKRSVFE